MSKWIGGVAVMAGCLLAGCTRADGDGAEVTVADTAAVSPGLDDAGIAALVAQLHAAEVEGAREAAERLQTPEVRAFAAAMVQEHGEMTPAASAATGEGSPGATAPPQLATMRAAARAHADLLAALPPGDTYDRTYMAVQVLRHAQAADSLRRWQRAARGDETRALVDATLPRVQTHLAESRRLQARLGGGAQGGVTLPPPQDTTWVDRLVRRQREEAARRQQAADSARRDSARP